MTRTCPLASLSFTVKRQSVPASVVQAFLSQKQSLWVSLRLCSFKAPRDSFTQQLMLHHILNSNPLHHLHLHDPGETQPHRQMDLTDRLRLCEIFLLSCSSQGPRRRPTCQHDLVGIRRLLPMVQTVRFSLLLVLPSSSLSKLFAHLNIQLLLSTNTSRVFHPSTLNLRHLPKVLK
jgi:hypothetical protein